jgi:anti-sigma-K factor RskA
MDLSRPDRRERLDQLAAQYALGTLPARARRRLALLARRDAAVAEAIRSWELRLASLADALPGVTPPLSVWNGISRRLGFATGDAGRAGPWWAKLALWRGLALASTLAAVVLGVVLVAGRLQGPEPTLVVVLTSQDARPVLLATISPDERRLTVKPVGPIQLPPERALELWALPEGAAPRSLGLVPATATARLDLPAAALARVPALAVSLEPAGGSPTGAPTGPVLYTGRIERL